MVATLVFSTESVGALRSDIENYSSAVRKRTGPARAPIAVTAACALARRCSPDKMKTRFDPAIAANRFWICELSCSDAPAHSCHDELSSECVYGAATLNRSSYLQVAVVLS